MPIVRGAALISVIVTTYNREDALDAALRALSRQSDEVRADLRFGDIERGAQGFGIVVTGRVGRLLVDVEGATRHFDEFLHYGGSCGQRLFGTHCCADIPVA